MIISLKMALLSGALSVSFMLAAGAATAQETSLKVFISAQSRPDVMRALFDQYEAQNPDVNIELETGGATSELQRNYLSTVLTAKDSSLDILAIDVVNPAQYAAAGWLEPLDAYIGTEKDALMETYLPAYVEANTVDGKLVALPAFSDAMMLFYRTDLFEKYGLQPPKTWNEAMESAMKIQQGEGDPQLQGVSFQAKAIEGAVCTFLLPYWSQGGTLDATSSTPLDEGKAVASFNMWLEMVEKGVAKENIAEVGTDDTRREFQDGGATMAVLWPYGWAHFQGDESAVKGKVGVAVLPAMEGGENVTCLGGYQWAVSAFSENKEEAVQLARYLSSPEASEFLAVNGSFLPTTPALYEDAEVLGKNAWFEQALPVLLGARARPVSPNYPRVSDAIRTRVNAVMAGTMEPEQAVEELQGELARALR